MKKKKIFYAAYGGGHINMILELYKTLKINPDYEHVVFGLTTAQLKLNALNIPFVSYLNYIKLFDPDALKYGKMLSEKLTAIADIPAEETYAYLGINYAELIDTYGKEQAEKLYQDKGRMNFHPLKSMTKILQEIKPDIVVTTNSPRTERATLQAAKALGIPSVCLNDIFDANDLRAVVKADAGTRVCVLNEYTKALLKDLGRSEGVVVTGNPAFDHIYDKRYEVEAEKLRKAKNAEGKTMVLWARSCLPSDIELSNLIEKKLIEFARNASDFVVVLRPHPNEKLTQPDNLPSNIYYSLRDEDLYTALHATDILYTLYSTVGLEAYMIGKHVLQQTNTTSFKQFNLVEACRARGISDIDTLPDVLRQIAQEPRPVPPTEFKSESAAVKISKVVADLLT